MAEENFQIKRGMDVVDTEGNRLGNVDTLLTEAESGMTRFMVVEKRLVPVETIRDVQGDEVRIDLPHDKLRQLPERRGSESPSPEDQQRAYDVSGVRVD